jgi:hypothetical protein
MKPKAILIVAAITLLPLGLHAADYMSATQKKFNQLDTNHDGYISKDEAKADSMLSEEWSKVDPTNKGKIDESEFSAFEEEMEPGGVPAKNPD